MLAIDSLSKTFAAEDGLGFAALADVDLVVAEHEIVSLVGASGCGKSTLLRILSGLEHATSGRVLLDGRPVTDPTPEVAMVFQEPRLMPWLSVADNVRLGLLDLPRRVQDDRIAAVLADVGLSDFANALPRQLSGGMAQRAAIARALARQPSILLMDEPFSALDSFTKAKLQDHLLGLWEASAFTIVFVTHDREEAAILSDRIAVMRGGPGKIQAEIAVDLPRPRRRTSPEVQAIKDRAADVQRLDEGAVLPQVAA